MHSIFGDNTSLIFECMLSIVKRYSVLFLIFEVLRLIPLKV